VTLEVTRAQLALAYSLAHVADVLPAVYPVTVARRVVVPGPDGPVLVAEAAVTRTVRGYQAYLRGVKGWGVTPLEALLDLAAVILAADDPPASTPPADPAPSTPPANTPTPPQDGAAA
jgi:hypothetical protein